MSQLATIVLRIAFKVSVGQSRNDCAIKLKTFHSCFRFFWALLVTTSSPGEGMAGTQEAGKLRSGPDVVFIDKTLARLIVDGFIKNDF